MCLETIYASKWIVLPPVFTQTSCSHLSHLEIFCRNTECNLKCYVHVLTLFVVTSLHCLKNGRDERDKLQFGK
uniref:Uncharacterized protein n=1 Tax=Glossina palpalis gambiensis TaxID=67801 RepID=A0A1B0BB76_9MUSC